MVDRHKGAVRPRVAQDPRHRSVWTEPKVGKSQTSNRVEVAAVSRHLDAVQEQQASGFWLNPIDVQPMTRRVVVRNRGKVEMVSEGGRLDFRHRDRTADSFLRGVIAVAVPRVSVEIAGVPA